MDRETREVDDQCGDNDVQEDGGSENRDCISDLPDCLITRILSCLPAEDAVRTCVLSKSWEKKWNSIYHIYVDSERDQAKIMDRILLNVDIRSVDLSFHFKYDANRINTWISTILGRNVEDVAIFFPNGYARGSIIISHSLLNCTSLRILKLRLCCTLKVSVKTWFLSLHSLNLEAVRILNDNPNNDMVKFDLPLLETLVLSNCEWLNMRFVEFCAPALYSFELGTHDLNVSDNCTIKIIAKRLAKFRSFGYNLRNLLLVGLTVGCAVLDHEDFIDEPVPGEDGFRKEGLKIRRLLNEFSDIEELQLQSYVVMAIAYSNVRTRHPPTVPMYDKLQRLAIFGQSCLILSCPAFHALLELLHSTPILKILDIEMTCFYDNSYGVKDKPIVHVKVPSCIVTHLEELHLKDFYGEAVEFHLAVFLLANGAKLKKFTLSRVEWCEMEKDELAQEFSGLSASASITVVDS